MNALETIFCFFFVMVPIALFGFWLLEKIGEKFGNEGLTIACCIALGWAIAKYW